MAQNIILKADLSLGFSKYIPPSYGTQRFITMYTKGCHQTLSWAYYII